MPGRFLEYAASLLRARAQNFLDSSLSDDGIRFLADPGIHEQFGDVFQPARLFVDEYSLSPLRRIRRVMSLPYNREASAERSCLM